LITAGISFLLGISVGVAMMILCMVAKERDRDEDNRQA